MDDQNFNKIQFSLNFRNPRHCFLKSANFFCFCFTMYTKRKSSQLKYKMGMKRPENLVSYFLYFSTYLLIICTGVHVISSLILMELGFRVHSLILYPLYSLILYPLYSLTLYPLYSLTLYPLYSLTLYPLYSLILYNL